MLTGGRDECLCIGSGCTWEHCPPRLFKLSLDFLQWVIIRRSHVFWTQYCTWKHTLKCVSGYSFTFLKNYPILAFIGLVKGLKVLKSARAAKPCARAWINCIKYGLNRVGKGNVRSSTMARDGKGWGGLRRDGKGWQGMGRDDEGWWGMGRDAEAKNTGE